MLTCIIVIGCTEDRCQGEMLAAISFAHNANTHAHLHTSGRGVRSAVRIANTTITIITTTADCPGRQASRRPLGTIHS